MSQLRRSIHDLLHDRQHDRILRLSFPQDDAPGPQLLVNKIDATEGLSRDFEFTVELLCDASDLALKEMQGKLLNIELVRRDGSLRYFSGYVFSFRRSHSDGGLTFYEAKLGPWLKFLSLRKETYDLALRLGRSETMKVEHEETVKQAERGKAKMPITADELEKRGIKALMASMWTGAAKPKSADDYEETYIHAKVAIVDDAAFTVGSANLNVRSMALDSELNLLSQAMDVAYDLRKKLFYQCTNEAGPVQFGDMEETFKDWLELMQDNTDAMAKRMPLKGQIANFQVDRQPGPPVI